MTSTKGRPRHNGTGQLTTTKEIAVSNTKNTHQPREHACACCACRDCGVRVTGRRVEPRTVTWNPSGLCDRHEAQRVEVAA